LPFFCPKKKPWFFYREREEKRVLQSQTEMAIELPERKKGNVFPLHTTSFVNKKKRAKIMGKHKACEKQQVRRRII